VWDLLHAWREWLAGHDITQIRLFGIEILWWGRIGKTLEFLGGLTVVVDLLGRARMAAFHDTLRRRRVRLIARLRRDKDKPAGHPKTGDPAGLRGFVVAGALAVGLFVFVGEHYAGLGGDPMPTPLLVAMIAILAPTVGGMAGLVGYLAGLLLLEAFAVTTLGQLRTREGLESRLKWIGLAIFVAGFSMDLLSS
jgi:hypothetical protein